MHSPFTSMYIKIEVDKWSLWGTNWTAAVCWSVRYWVRQYRHLTNTVFGTVSSEDTSNQSEVWDTEASDFWSLRNLLVQAKYT
jgi:hypothetical protein